MGATCWELPRLATQPSHRWPPLSCPQAHCPHGEGTPVPCPQPRTLPFPKEQPQRALESCLETTLHPLHQKNKTI